ncbi:MAG TPA: hypothetical protein VIP11_06745 [Gemmatimonadaceae bacterium]
MASLSYTFWHWKRASVDSAQYEAQQRAFHSALAANPPEGFQFSVSSEVAGAEWANSGGDAYQDRYVVHDFGALESLDQGAVSGARQRSHDNAAAVAAGGVAGIYSTRLGSPDVAPRFAYWFSKPEGVSYAEVDRALSPLVRDHDAVLWMRRMVLGPTPEFCLESSTALRLPPGYHALELTLRPIWP